MALPGPVAVAKRAVEYNTGKIIEDVPKGRKTPRSDAASAGHYERGEYITILCFTVVNTTPVNGDA